MSASSTTSSTSCSQEECEVVNDSTPNQKLLQASHATNVTPSTYANSSMSTLDRSHYQSLPLSGTRRVTVQFGHLKVVVPWKESDSTVGELADAALTRYKKAKGLNTETRVRVLRLECASDGGILDMDDVLEDVFDLNYDQILAITDEANGSSSTPTYAQIHKPSQHQPHHYAQPLPFSRRPEPPVASAYGSVSVNRSASPFRRNSVVEVNNFDAVPQSGLRVSTPVRSSLRTGDEATPTKQSRVTMSPEVEKRIAEQDERRRSERHRHYEKKNSSARFNRGSDRKSRINDALLDARERIVDQLESTSSSRSKRDMEPGPVAGTTLFTFAPLDLRPDNEEARQMGVEVNAVFDEETPGPSSSKLSALQIMRIDDGGRVAKDGRIRVGDCIREIDGRPVAQMSVIRARACLAELATATRDVGLLINRSIESFREQEAEEKAAAEAKPIQSALQQANTQYIGHTTLVELVKSSNGFGFTVTGRETSKGERLFYIGTVKPYGVALGHLKSGDRLLEIDGQSTGQFTQPQIVEKLKETMVGAKIRFLVSRVSQTPSSTTTTASSENKENEETTTHSKMPEKLPLPALLTSSRDSPTSPTSSSACLSPTTRFELEIPVNGSGSAGLGVSLKARVSKKSNGTKQDCGIFIKNVMHGGAAFKEGRLRVDDRIVGVEDVDLESLSNTEASQALAQKLKEIGPTSAAVKLRVVRLASEPAGAISRDSSRITVDVSSPASSRMSSSLLLPSPAGHLHSRHSSSNSSSGRPPNQRDSIVSDATTRLDDSEAPDNDPFDREAPGRKSLSEKRGLGAAADPQHIKLFQEIKHQRQNSAPTGSTQKRSKSQPRSLSQRNYRSPMKLIDLAQAQAQHASPQQLDDSDMLNRRSQSMESINRPVESILRGTGPSKVQFAANQHPFPPGSALMRLKTEESRARDKSRRKSMGNAFSAMRNFFGFGTKSRDVSPEKAVESTPPPPLPQHQTARRGSGSGVYVDYGEPYGLVPQYPHNSTSGYESYTDADLYDRYAAHRYHHHARFGHDDEQVYRQQSGSSINPPTYVNYGLSTSHAYHVDARIPPPPPQVSGSVSSASLRRAYPDYDDHQRRAASSGRNSDYHHMFNTWFAYTGGGAVGAAPLIKSSFHASPVRIAAASGLDRSQGRGRSTSSGAIGSFGAHAGAATDKYADARGGGTGTTRLFVPRLGSTEGGGGRSSPGHFRRQQPGAPATHRFPQY